VCGNQIVNRHANLKETYDLVIFVRDCGATTDYSYQLSVLKHGEKLKNEPGNIYITVSPFNAEWTSSDSLKIYETVREAYKRKYRHIGVKIEYN